MVVVVLLQELSAVAVQLAGTHDVDVLVRDEAERRQVRAVSQGGGGAGGGGGLGRAVRRTRLQPVVLHLGEGADGGQAQVVVAAGGAVAARRLHALQVGAAELGHVAAVGVGHRGQTAAQRRRVELRGVGAALLQQLSVHVLPRFVDLGAAAAAAALLTQLAFALFAAGAEGGGRRLFGPLGGRPSAFGGAAPGRGVAPAAAAGGVAAAAAAVVGAAAAAVVPSLDGFGLDVHLDLHTVSLSGGMRGKNINQGSTLFSQQNSSIFRVSLPTFTVTHLRDKANRNEF